MPYNLVGWAPGEFDNFTNKGTFSMNKQGGNMPPATPDPKTHYGNNSYMQQPSTRGGNMFPYRAGNDYPMASPMYMPFMNESPRPETRAARYQNQNSGNFSLTINYNDFSQNNPQN